LDPDLKEMARQAVDSIRDALRSPSPFGELGERLQAAAPEERTPVEPDEDEAWQSAEDERMRSLAERVIRHAHSIGLQRHVGPSQKLLQLRSILALDLAHYTLQRSWDATQTASEKRYLLASYTPEERRANRVRVHSEASYQAARQRVSQAIIATLGEAMAEIAASKDRDQPWNAYFEPRSQLHEVADALERSFEPADFARQAERAFELASGGGYGRQGDAFRVLLESVDLLIGTGQYRYLRAGPELLGALVGALSPELPAPAERFLELVFEEWGIVIGEAEAVGTDVSDQVEGSELLRNARFLEDLLVNAGLAVALSDQTFMVGLRQRDAA
jgi:hypothetical protein